MLFENEPFHILSIYILQEARQQLIQEGIERREEREPWRQRFTALGTALYSTDTDKSGKIPNGLNILKLS